MTVTEVIATALPSYEIGGEIGRGSWGVVLKAHHRQLARNVAIKQLPMEFAADPSVRRRFVNEARLLASLDHPHIVPIYDYIEREGLCLLVMEYLPGGTVWSHFTTTGITMETSCSLTMATCAGLQYAHERGVLHRDVKPENLMFSAGDTLKVTDFGIAKMVSGTHTMATRAGEVLGSPAYIAPEQATGGELGPATDVYATAVMLYELLSGRLPFPEDGDPLMVLYRHVHEPPTPILDVAPNVPPAIAGVVMQGLANQVAHRYQSAQEFGVAIAEAGTAVWGPGWLQRADITLMGGGPIQAAAERPSQPPAAYVSPGFTPPATAPTQDGPVPPAGAVPIHAADPTRSSSGPSLSAIGPSDLVAVEQVQTVLPASPALPALVAAALTVATLILATLGVGAKPSLLPDDPPGGTISIQGQDLAKREPLTIDFSRPLDVSISRLAPGAQASAASVVRVNFSAGGISLGTAEGKLVSSETAASAKIDARSLQYFVAGEVVGEITIRDGAVTRVDRFTTKSRQNSLFTVPGIGTIALLLFAAAYVEATMRSMRRGRRRTGGIVELGVLGAIIGLGFVLLSWLLRAQIPYGFAYVACAILGAAAGVATGVTMKRIGASRRSTIGQFNA